jgi:hypothetical protein
MGGVADDLLMVIRLNLFKKQERERERGRGRKNDNQVAVKCGDERAAVVRQRNRVAWKQVEGDERLKNKAKVEPMRWK